MSDRTASDRRRAEIEAKRAKLAELRKARLERQEAETRRRNQEASPTTPHRVDADDVVTGLLGSNPRMSDNLGDSTPISTPGTPALGRSISPNMTPPGPSGRASRQSGAFSDRTPSGGTAGGDDSEGKRVKRVCAFYDERYCKNRSIVDLDWSPKYPELGLASYNKNPAALNEPDGLVAV